MNASARLTMKDAANCDKQCELQNSVNHQISERTLRYRVFLIACLVSASSKPIMPSRVQNVLSWSVRFCAPVRCPWGNHWRMKCVCATHKVASTTFSIILLYDLFCCGGTCLPYCKYVHTYTLKITSASAEVFFLFWHESGKATRWI